MAGSSVKKAKRKARIAKSTLKGSLLTEASQLDIAATTDVQRFEGRSLLSRVGPNTRSEAENKAKRTGLVTTGASKFDQQLRLDIEAEDLIKRVLKEEHGQKTALLKGKAETKKKQFRSKEAVRTALLKGTIDKKEAKTLLGNFKR